MSDMYDIWLYLPQDWWRIVNKFYAHRTDGEFNFFALWFTLTTARHGLFPTTCTLLRLVVFHMGFGHLQKMRRRG